MSSLFISGIGQKLHTRLDQTITAQKHTDRLPNILLGRIKAKQWENKATSHRDY